VADTLKKSYMYHTYTVHMQHICHIYVSHMGRKKRVEPWFPGLTMSWKCRSRYFLSPLFFSLFFKGTERVYSAIDTFRNSREESKRRVRFMTWRKPIRGRLEVHTKVGEGVRHFPKGCKESCVCKATKSWEQRLETAVNRIPQNNRKINISSTRWQGGLLTETQQD